VKRRASTSKDVSYVVELLRSRYGAVPSSLPLGQLRRSSPQLDRFDWSLFILATEIDLKIRIRRADCRIAESIRSQSHPRIGHIVSSSITKHRGPEPCLARMTKSQVLYAASPKSRLENPYAPILHTEPEGVSLTLTPRPSSPSRNASARAKSRSRRAVSLSFTMPWIVSVDKPRRSARLRRVRSRYSAGEV